MPFRAICRRRESCIASIPTGSLLVSFLADRLVCLLNMEGDIANAIMLMGIADLGETLVGFICPEVVPFVHHAFGMAVVPAFCLGSSQLQH